MPGDYVEVRRYTALVATGREVEHMSRACDRDLRLRGGAFQRGKTGDAVLGFLHRRQHDAAIIGHGDVVTAPREIDVGTQASGIDLRDCTLRRLRRAQRANSVLALMKPRGVLSLV